MVIEFYGVSGVGKSFLSNRLRRELDERGVKYMGIPAKTPFGGNYSGSEWRSALAGAILSTPLSTVSLLIRLLALCRAKGVQTEGLRGRLRTAIKWWLRLTLYASSLQELRKTGETYMLERGTATNLLSILVRMGSTEIGPLYRHLARRGALSDLVVIVEADPDTVTRRRRERGNPDKAWMSFQQEEFRRFSIIKQLVMKDATEGELDAIVVDSTADRDVLKNVRQLADLIAHKTAAVN